MTRIEDLPVLILGYMRVEGILRCLESCHQAGIRRVYIALDGPKDSKSLTHQQEGIDRILKFVELRGIELTLRRRHSNAGLAVGVIEGISWFFEQEQQGVILEDDLVVSTDFFQFSMNALEKFGDHPKIALISGNNYLSVSSARRISASHYPLIWGWATTRQTWCAFIDTIDRPLRPMFNRNLKPTVNSFWWTAAKQSRSGLVDSWAMSFSHFIRMHDLICLQPPVNLVSNCGSDQHAVHSNKSDPLVNFPLGKLYSDIDWELPTRDVISAQDLHAEQIIYRISNRNLLSPFKFLLGYVFIKKLKHKVSLADRVNTSIQKADFSVTKRGA
jgi:hypothetical protein